MAAAASFPTLVSPPEQRTIVNGVSWKDYVILREALDTPGLRMTYLKGTLELASSSRAHERNKKTIARLIETYAVLRRLPLIGYGSTTFRREARERGAEPDECWCVGHQMRDGEFPDIAFEVIELSPLLDKLAVYDGLEVPEVWLFEAGAFALHGRRKAGGYEPLRKSRLLPGLDFGLVARYATREDQHVALAEFADAIARGPKGRARGSRAKKT
jgi:Uma2 family endonuclease